MNDIPSTDIIGILVDKYGICTRQANRYVFMANASLDEKHEVNIKRKKAWYKARKLRALRDMDPKEKKTAKGVETICKVYDSLAAMDGIVTKKVELVGNKDNPIELQHSHLHAHLQINYKSMPTEMLEMLLYQARGINTKIIQAIE